MSVVTQTARRLSTGRRRGRLGDPVFVGLTRLAGLLVLGVLVAITVFLVVKALPAFHEDRGNFWTTTIWDPDGSGVFGIAAIAFGTALSSAMALVMAFPVALGVALFATQYAPPRLGRLIGYITDLLAAVPSVVFGLWGLYFLVPHLGGVQQYLSRYLGFIPLFANPHGEAVGGRSLFATSVVLAIMILPIISAITREVVRQVDPAVREAALALGATRWEVIRIAVLPSSRSGIAGAVILGLGRALGETIAVALVLGTAYHVNLLVLLAGNHNTIAANIANQFGEAGSVGRAALIASGLVLFAMTMLVTMAARAIIYRSGRLERSAAV